MPGPRSHRLPQTIVPDRYEIRLAPDLSSATFAGTETVYVTIHSATSEIVLNSAELEIQQVLARGKDGNSLPAKVQTDAANEQAVLTFAETLQPGSWQLHLTFTGILNDKLHGFYRSTYKDERGQPKVLASTQFESTDARRAFPCWDEPAFKSVFQITLVVDAPLAAISNARVIRETPLPGGKKEVVFADTIKMSTYLVAFIVGEFEGTEPTRVGDAPVRVWAVPGKGHLGRFAQNVGTFSLSFFSRYYDIPYPGDKLDLIAIPDFASGAMENLGAITFRETALLVDEERSTRSELERVADVVCHENAHMWFGDLVTMRWWNGLWLNEAFATFMEMLAVDAWKPEWRRWESFTVSRAAALHVDGLKSTRPIEFPVEKPDEAAGMFDVLTYEKGASVLRMLEQYLGPEAFCAGIRVYLRRHAYDNAETTDLWDALENSSGQPVRALMDSWIFQPGYPLITVKKDGSGIVLSQRIFQYLADGAGPERSWHVPIFLRARAGGKAIERTVLLTKVRERIELDKPVDWVVANAGGHGFYRARYAPDLMTALQRNLHDNLAAVERFNLVNDAWATTLAGLTSLPEYLSLVDLLRDESSLSVWTTVLGSCHHLNRIFDERQRLSFRARIRATLVPAFTRLGWAPEPGESELESQLRGELLTALGTVAEDSSLQNQARERYGQYEGDPKSVDRNLIPALVAVVAHTGAESEYEKFYANFKNARTPQEEQRYLFALASFRAQALIRHTLELTVNGEVRTQNAPYLMRALLFNIEGREVAWSFMKAQWDEMLKKYPDNSIPRMCEGIVALVTPELEADVTDFFARHPVSQGTKQLEQHLERLRVAVACKGRWNELLRDA